MYFRGVIHYKNDEEELGEIQDNYDAASQDLKRLRMVETHDDEDVQFFMIETIADEDLETVQEDEVA